MWHELRFPGFPIICVLEKDYWSDVVTVIAIICPIVKICLIIRVYGPFIRLPGCPNLVNHNIFYQTQIELGDRQYWSTHYGTNRKKGQNLQIKQYTSLNKDEAKKKSCYSSPGIRRPIRAHLGAECCYSSSGPENLLQLICGQKTYYSSFGTRRPIAAHLSPEGPLKLVWGQKTCYSSTGTKRPFTAHLGPEGLLQLIWGQQTC